MEWTLRPATAADLPRMAAIVNAQMPEPIQAEDLAREWRLLAADPWLRLLAVAPDGRVAGFGTGRGGTALKPGHFELRVRVDLPDRCQGAGRALYGALVEWAVAQGAVRLISGVREEDAEAQEWAWRRGYVKEYHLFESTLVLPEWDPAPFHSAVAQAEAAGYRFTTLAAEMQGEETYRRYYEWVWLLADDVPGHAGTPRMDYAVWRRWAAETPEWDPALLFLAVRGGQWAALAQVEKKASGGLYNGFTAVDRAERGNGLALAVKVYALERVRALGFPYIRTHNHSVNERMLAVNRRLGYVPKPGLFRINKEVHHQVGQANGTPP